MSPTEPYMWTRTNKWRYVNTCDICNILKIFVKCYWTSLDMVLYTWSIIIITIIIIIIIIVVIIEQ